MEIFVHRGGQTNPNTISAFKKCVELGVDGIEADICLSGDGEPIIYHPEVIDPPTQDPLNMRWKHIRQDYPQIPHLYQLLNFLKDNPKLKCLLDIKTDSQELVGTVLGKLWSHPAKDRIFLTSPHFKIPFLGLNTNIKTLVWFKKFKSETNIHVIETIAANFIIKRAVKKYRPEIISFGWLPDSSASRILFSFLIKTKLLNLRKLQPLRKSGVKLLGGIVNTEKELRYFIGISEYAPVEPLVDMILTDEPEMALKVR